MSKKILHIGSCSTFMTPFIEFVKDNFDLNNHHFLLLDNTSGTHKNKSKHTHLAESTILARLNYYIKALVKMHQAEKVVLHGLFDIKLVLILFFTPWLLKKCYWVMWGGDLYLYQVGERNWKWKVCEFFRRPVIKNMGQLVTYIEGDVKLAREWYGAKGKYYECLMYTSNLYKEYKISNKNSRTINILVGNSADPSNNHIAALDKIYPYKDEDICIYVPLSYGSQQHAEEIISKGEEWFGNKLKPLTEFMPFDEYLSLLGSIDIAVFNHKRQQAMGNTITLLGLGKTVYMRSDTTQWQFFQDKGVVVGDIEQMNSFDTLKAEDNINIIKSYFSKENYLKQLSGLF